MVAHAFNLTAGETETGGFLVSLASQTSLVVETQASERTYLKKLGR